MSSNKRNFIVGITVLGALLGLFGMMLRFGGITVRFLSQGEEMEIYFTGDRADGLAEGAQVKYLGFNVGRVTQVLLNPDERTISITAMVSKKNSLPGNVEGVIRTQGVVSSIAELSLEVQGGLDAKPAGKLTDHQHLVAKFAGANLIPPEFAEVAKQVRDMQLVAHLDADVRSAGETLKGLKDYVDDPVTKANLQTSINNFRSITESVNRSSANIERFSNRLDKIGDDANTTVALVKDDVARIDRQIDDRMLQVSKLLETAQAISTKVNAGDGSAALLLNDPKLYRSLVDNSKQLNLAIADLKRLVEQWEQEGVSFKVK